MKRFLIVFVLCLASRCFASLPQISANFAGSASGTSPLTATAVGNLTSDTTLGDTIVIVMFGTGTQASGSLSLAMTCPTTAGFSWSASQISSQWLATDNWAGIVGICFIANAGVMASTVTTTCANLQTGSGVHSVSITVECTLYEFPPITSMDTHIQRANGGRGTLTTVDTANLTATATDLVIVAYSGNQVAGGSNISAGAGYTLGSNAATSAIGQMQYNMSVAAGSVATAFTGQQYNFSAVAAAYKLASSSSVPRHRGSVF